MKRILIFTFSILSAFNFQLSAFNFQLSTLKAQNPIVHTCFTTDPAPIVSGDRLYVFTGHDEDGADFFWMNEWRLFSTTDMVNWQDMGCPLSQCDFSWADDRAWAPQCIERNGMFYLYVPIHSKLSGGMAIGVAVADKIEGPYHDALGKPLYEDGKWDHIDPTVFIDTLQVYGANGQGGSNGSGGSRVQAYIGWGNPRFYSARLSDDMIHLASDVRCDSTIQRYTEGPWLMKHGAKYLLLYAAGGIPECIAYSESDRPQGPWKYVGEVMAQTDSTNSFTNHSGIVRFKGHDYFFYHTGWLPGGGGFGRSVSVEEFQWQPDGNLPLIAPTREGVKPIGTLNPLCPCTIVEAETMACSHGVKTEWNKKHPRIWVSDIHNGDWTEVREVDFSVNNEGLRVGEQSPGMQLTVDNDRLTMSVTASSGLQGGEIEVRLDSLQGEKICTIAVHPTGGWEEWQQFSAPMKAVSGKHDVFFLFKGMKGCKLFNWDSWQINLH